MAFKLSIIDHENNMFTCTIVLLLYLKLLLNLNMNVITTKAHGFTTICYCLWLFCKCPYSQVAKSKNDKILLYSLMITA